MTDLMHYEKGCSPSAIQRKYSLTYEQGYELAERLKKTQELELEVRRENTKLKELLKECGIANETLVCIMDWLIQSVIPEQRECCEELFVKVQKLQTLIDEVLK